MIIMISLTTTCRRLDNVFLALSLTLPTLTNSSAQEFQKYSFPITTNSSSPAPANRVPEKPQPTVFQKLIPSSTNDQQDGSVVGGTQEPETDQLNPDQDVEPDVLMRGSLHEAFAEAYQADPVPNPIVNATPPDPINELQPEFRPEGQNVQWIGGYWA